MKFLFRSVVSLLFFVVGAPVIGQEALRFELDGKSQTIKPLGYTTRMVLGVKRDGYLLETPATSIKSPAVLPRFRPFSQSEMRGALMAEFGKSFDVTGTGSFLIVHPRGTKDLWAFRFEELYRSMVQFFRARGLPMSRPKFPLVGVVFHSQQQYMNYCQRVLKQNASSSYGMYTPLSNRIYLFDATRGTGKKSQHWEENLSTVLHEAAHQTAFNTGIHIRGATTPAWLAEGLGCLFEAPGIHSSSKYRQPDDKLNPGRLYDYRRLAARGTADHLKGIVSSDREFRSDQSRGYAVAWALTHYLSEKQPREYIRYIKSVARREVYEDYSPSQRIKDFTRNFGRDFDMLAARLNRFVDSMPKQ